MRNRLNQRGDTIIEVILAMALLALVLFTAWSVTNRASQISLAARQRVVMVNQLKEQAELLKAFNQVGPEKIKQQADRGLTAKPSANPCNDINVSFSDDDNEKDGKLSEARIVEVSDTTDPANTNFSFMKGSKQVEGDTTQRIWLQRDGSASNPRFVDFYVRGCWKVTGGSQKLDNAQFLVRINT